MDAPKSVYLASRFSRRLELRKLRDDLEQYGIECTSSWLDESPESAHYDGLIT